MPSAFIPDKGGIAELARDAGIASHLGEVAELAAARVLEIAPEDEGDYKDGIKTDFGVDERGAYGRVNAFDYKSWWIEMGTVDTPAFAPLRTAVESLGLTITGDGTAIE